MLHQLAIPIVLHMHPNRNPDTWIMMIPALLCEHADVSVVYKAAISDSANSGTDWCFRPSQLRNRRMRTKFTFADNVARGRFRNASSMSNGVFTVGCNYFVKKHCCNWTYIKISSYISTLELYTPLKNWHRIKNRIHWALLLTESIFTC